MARKIHVVERISRDVRRDLPKSVAIQLVARQFAEWVTENVSIRILSIKSLPICALRSIPPTHIVSKYIPNHMPPREVPGVYFKPPELETLSRLEVFGHA